MGVLDRHGTRAFVLKPSSVAAAAEADIELRNRQRGEPERILPYCFCRQHVARASCALDLIDRAIADRYSGVYSGKRITRLMYGQDGLLEAARSLAAPTAGAAEQHG